MLAREVSSYLTEAAAGAKTPPPSRRTVCDPNHRVMADLLQPAKDLLALIAMIAKKHLAN
jgi:hypothetical protein